ncbi:MAG TPA: TIGR04282 family arsenosugar biosynthesis glycosyltransferase [Geobacteraceae bacterium]|nr:TIGR04282 family arsenosugar biosynthesis glycosyltransferase [Geobacteraceae bacterium]
MNEKALIIFARQPAPGEVKTRLVPPLSPAQASLLYHFMLADIINGTESLEGVDRVLFYTGGEGARGYFLDRFPGLPLYPQEGDDLGSRMEEAFSRVFAEGYRFAAIIGTDSPDLPVSFIDDAFRLLAGGKTEVVFGPAEDGGYYLLAMKRVHHELFHGISWGGGSVLRESLEKAGAMGLEVSELMMWGDVDTFEDLAGLAERAGGGCAPLTLRFIKDMGL